MLIIILYIYVNLSLNIRQNQLEVNLVRCRRGSKIK